MVLINLVHIYSGIGKGNMQKSISHIFFINQISLYIEIVGSIVSL